MFIHSKPPIITLPTVVASPEKRFHFYSEVSGEIVIDGKRYQLHPGEHLVAKPIILPMTEMMARLLRFCRVPNGAINVVGWEITQE